MPGRLPTAEDFPKSVTLSIVPPPDNDPPTNILILLHGLGDGHDAFTNLGKQMNLPDTACISIRGPKALLDLEGAHWGDDIIFDDTTGGLDADAGLKESTTLLQILVNEHLVAECGYKPREIMLFGFGQGGMVALSTAVSLHQAASDPAAAELGGVISIGAPLPSEAPAGLVVKSKSPVLVCAGGAQSSVTSTSEEKLKRLFEFVEVKRYRKPGDSMPSNRDEMMPIMQFFSRRLRSTKGVPAGSQELS